MTWNVLDLFSGIGGFSLGLERAGMRTIAFCEIDPFCRDWLDQQWPGVRCFDDVEKLSFACGFLTERSAAQRLLGSGATVRDGAIRCRCGRQVWPLQAGDVAVAAEARSPDAATGARGAAEPLLPGRADCERQHAEQGRERAETGGIEASYGLRDVRRIAEVFGREERGSSASRRLQQATGDPLALSEMPSRMAQEQPCCSQTRKEVKNAEAFGLFVGAVDVLAGGFP